MPALDVAPCRAARIMEKHTFCKTFYIKLTPLLDLCVTVTSSLLYRYVNVTSVTSTLCDRYVTVSVRSFPFLLRCSHVVCVPYPLFIRLSSGDVRFSCVLVCCYGHVTAKKRRRKGYKTCKTDEKRTRNGRVTDE